MSTASVTQTGGAATVAVTVSRGLQGVQGIQGATGATGAQGDRAGLKYTFDDQTGAGAPSPGHLKFNSSTLSAVTRISIRDTDFDGSNTSALLALIDDSTSTIKARVVIRSNSNADASHFNFLVTSVTDEGNHHHINGTYVSGSAFTANEIVTFDFYQTGDKGEQGIQGIQGVPGEPGDITASQITDSTAAGRALLTAANAAAQITALGAISNQAQFLERFMRHPNATISTSSVANPTVITTTAAHKLTTGDIVGINGHTGSTPSVAGQYTVTVLSPTTFSIPVNVTVGGTGGVVGEVVQSTQLPEIGTAWRMSLNSTGSAFGSEFPHLTPFGMRSAREILLYMGTEHTEPITSMTLHMNWRASATPAAISRNGITISVSASPLLSAGAPGSIFLPGRMLHMSIVRDQPPNVGLGTGAGGAVWTEPTSTRVSYTAPPTGTVPYGVPPNADSIIRIELETGEMRVFTPGAIWTYNDSRFNSDLIGPHWWIEFSGDRYNGTDYKEVPYIRNVWLNSPKLDMLPGWGTQPRSDVLDRLSSDGLITLSNNFTFGGDVTINGSVLHSGTSFKITPWATFGAKWAVANLETKTSADISSTAGMVYTAGSLLSMGGRTLATAGACNTYEVSGFFADTANDRRLALNESFAGDVFDSGVLAAANVRNKHWRIFMTIQRTGSHAKRFMTTLQIDGQPTMIQTKSSTTATAGNTQVRCSSVAAADVQIFTYISRTETPGT